MCCPGEYLGAPISTAIFINNFYSNRHLKGIGLCIYICLYVCVSVSQNLLFSVDVGQMLIFTLWLVVHGDTVFPIHQFRY